MELIEKNNKTLAYSGLCLPYIQVQPSNILEWKNTLAYHEKLLNFYKMYLNNKCVKLDYRGR